MFHRHATDRDVFFNNVENLIRVILYKCQFRGSQDKTLSRQNPKRLAVLMEGAASPSHAFRYEPISKEELSEAGHYVSAR